MLDHLKNYRIILASKSPRRQQLLGGMDIDFEVFTNDCDESFPSDMPPVEVAPYLSRKKSLAYPDNELPKDFLLITADTVVIVDGQILNKPGDTAHARQMLNMLQGRRHLVVTGFTLRSATKILTESDVSEVEFMPLDKDEIDYYVHAYKPFDKAGAYGIQEWIGYVGIASVAGSFFNVMGLPTHKLYQALKHFG
ncbi:MAG: septum formation protein Maf [Bacteroidetes bacterium]|nr:septum formation protein Maf [Bacteroidota bacterium]